MIHGVNTANIQETHEKSNEIIKNSLKVKKAHEGKKQQEPSQKVSDVKKSKVIHLKDLEGKKQHEPSQKINVVKKKIQCSTCFQFFWTQKNLIEHVASAHMNICQKIMKEKNLLSAPMETKVERPLPFEFNNHLSINKNNFPCKICSRICQSNYLLARHVSTVHEGKNLQVVQPSRESYMTIKENNFLSAPMKTKFEYPLPFEKSKIHEGRTLDIKEIDIVQNSRF